MTLDMKIGRARKSSFVLAVVLAAMWILSISAVSWANGPEGYGHHRRHGYGGHSGHGNPLHFIGHVLGMKDRLGLTDDQEARLRTIAVGYKKDRVVRTADIELAEIDVNQLLHARNRPANTADIEN